MGLLSHGMRGKGAPLAEIAARQHGVVALAQLAALGLDREAVRRRVEDGRLHRVHRGVYAVGHSRLTREARWMRRCSDAAQAPC